MNKLDFNQLRFNIIMIPQSLQKFIIVNMWKTCSYKCPEILYIISYIPLMYHSKHIYFLPNVKIPSIMFLMSKIWVYCHLYMILRIYFFFLRMHMSINAHGGQRTVLGSLDLGLYRQCWATGVVLDPLNLELYQ